MDNKRMIPE